MAIYLFRCRTCGRTRESFSRDDIVNCVCGGISRRDYSTVQFGTTGLAPHFSHAVGEFVTNNRSFDDALKRRAEENTRRTGAEHSYVRIDPGDIPQPNTATEAFETRAKTIQDGKMNPNAIP